MVTQGPGQIFCCINIVHRCTPCGVSAPVYSRAVPQKLFLQICTDKILQLTCLRKPANAASTMVWFYRLKLIDILWSDEETAVESVVFDITAVYDGLYKVRKPKPTRDKVQKAFDKRSICSTGCQKHDLCFRECWPVGTVVVLLWPRSIRQIHLLSLHPQPG